MSVLASCFQELANQHFYFLRHRDWFRHGQRSQDDSVRLNLVGFGIIIGREIGFLSVVTKL